MDQVSELILKEGQKYGNVEVGISDSNSVSLTYENNTFKRIVEGDSLQLEIRISKGKKFGYATTNNLQDWKNCLNASVKLLKLAKPLKQEIKLQSKKERIKSTGTFSEKIKNMSFDDLIKKGKALYKTIKSVDRHMVLQQASIEKIEFHNLFANSNGVASKEKHTLLSSFASCAKGSVTGSEVHISHKPFDVKQVGNASAKLCIRSQNPQKIKPMKVPLVLDYFAAASLLSAILVPNLSANNIHAGKSILKDKIGCKIFSDKLNITDDGTLKEGIFTSSLDAEGSPRKKTNLIQKGVLTNYLFDSYSARLSNKKSTGNCASLEKIPSVGPSNFVIKPGRYSKDQILSGIDSGIWTTFAMGTHVVNEITGDISVGLENAFYIEKGEIKFPVAQAMVSLNLFDALKDIQVLGNKLRQETSVATPLIKIEEAQIIS